MSLSGTQADKGAQWIIDILNADATIKSVIPDGFWRVRPVTEKRYPIGAVLVTWDEAVRTPVGDRHLYDNAEVQVQMTTRDAAVTTLQTTKERVYELLDGAVGTLGDGSRVLCSYVRGLPDRIDNIDRYYFATAGLVFSLEVE